ncbi:hypothetical protein TorRG33x02_354960, partial [Trema orientale]
ATISDQNNDISVRFSPHHHHPASLQLKGRPPPAAWCRTMPLETSTGAKSDGLFSAKIPTISRRFELHSRKIGSAQPPSSSFRSVVGVD